MSKYTTPAERIAELVAEHGSYRAAAEAIGVDYAYLHRVASGAQSASPALLSALGMHKEVSIVYWRLGA